ncbi:MerR family transcriptional regulator, partial [Streptomyces sp. NPDC000410]|uniref:DNA polymerase III subunit beta family protein n=1 Tax=Streptomyces sp. NPDC000410 TaxID=3154254 RepID=UPI003319CB77
MDPVNDERLLSISAFARRVGLSPSALRFYDDCQVFPPAYVDGVTGYRYYGPEQEERGRLLRGLREAGLGLGEVGVVLDGSPDEARAVLERYREAVRTRAKAADATIAGLLEEADRVRVGGAEFAGAVRQVVPAAGRGGEHPVLGCVLVEIEDGELRLVATDRYRLAMRVLRPLAVSGSARRLLVEAGAMAGIGAWAARSAEVTIEGDTVHGEDGSRELPCVEGEFPAYRDMLAALAPPAHRVIVDRLALRDAVEGLDGPFVLGIGEDEIVAGPVAGADAGDDAEDDAGVAAGADAEDDAGVAAGADAEDDAGVAAGADAEDDAGA